ncbi:unnamed protein product [Pseudo-nitzschia multistriata]|uniref:50S ribosomal protein L35 n=1 Tax=Pseudo-nitzschia multistriata TaxID=183589 RepID=A0A448Z9R7_9STRA|nr:unnamed protein product [Pseudo-nitzschia multistriata]
MSLLWNWGAKSLLRRSPAPLAAGRGLSRSMRSGPGPAAAPVRGASLSLAASPAPSPAPWYHLLTPLRYKSGMKTHSGAKKRFRVRGSGSIKRPKSGKSHNTGYLKRQRANRLGHSTGIEGKKIEQRVRKLLGVFNA